ncbi:MAG: hypothetical protein CMP61_11375 [Flavobacteriales bacterium]|nr:hypothetical protein [Flavobacteriales bacterium]|tara:strand:- start:3788 stop:4285 length:498 start_codon:yes stop_codon:yes gene_type:complete
MKSFCFIGLPHSGKSLFGRKISSIINKKYIDTDNIIKKKFNNNNLNDIILNKGEKQYLKEESKVIKHINKNNIILSTGGSAIYCKDGMNHIKNNLNCEIIYLKLSLKEFNNRLIDYNSRGIINPNNLSINNLYEERVYLYNMYKDISFDADNKVELYRKLIKYFN